MSTPRRFDVVVVGGINTDFFAVGRQLPRPGMSLDATAFREGPGGKGANAAVAAARLRVATALIGRVGSDDRGRTLVTRLAREHVDVTQVSVDAQAVSGAAVIQLDDSGQKQVLAALGANMALTTADIARASDVIRAGRLLLMQLEVPVDCVGAAARIAREAGVLVVLDPAPPRPLPEAFIASVHAVRGNAGEIEAVSGVAVRNRASARDAGRALLARGVRLVVTAVDGGNLVVGPTGDEWLPELPIERVDTTGAGDAFAAALAVALGEGQEPVAAARFASGAAALATRAVGGQTSLPTRQELDAYLRQAR